MLCWGLLFLVFWWTRMLQYYSPFGVPTSVSFREPDGILRPLSSLKLPEGYVQWRIQNCLQQIQGHQCWCRADIRRLRDRWNYYMLAHFLEWNYWLRNWLRGHPQRDPHRRWNLWLFFEYEHGPEQNSSIERSILCSVHMCHWSIFQVDVPIQDRRIPTQCVQQDVGCLAMRKFSNAEAQQRSLCWSHCRNCYWKFGWSWNLCFHLREDVWKAIQYTKVSTNVI